ncbi:hypothetical protein D3C78_441600 [compost metagenome]
MPCISAIGEQYQRAGYLLGRQQAFGYLDHPRHVLAGLGNQISAQRLQERVEQVRVFGSRQYQVRAAGIGDQRRARTRPAHHQVVQGVLGRLQTARRDIVGVHRRRQVQRKNQRRTVVDERRDIPLPCRPGSGQGAQAKQCCQQMHRPYALALFRRDDQMLHQVRGDDALQLPFQVMAPLPGPRQQRRRNPQQ